MSRRSLVLTAFGALLTLVVWLDVTESRRRAPEPGELSKSTAAGSVEDPLTVDLVTPHTVASTEPIIIPLGSSNSARTSFSSALPLDVELELMVGRQTVTKALLVLEGTGPTGPFVEQIEWSAESPRLRHRASELTLTAYGGVVTNDGPAEIVARGESERIELASADRNGTTVLVQMHSRPWVMLHVTYEDSSRPEMWAAIVPQRAFDPARPASAFHLEGIHMVALPDATSKTREPERLFCVVGLEPGPHVVGIGRPGEPPVSFAYVPVGAGGSGPRMRLPLATHTERIRVRCTTPDATRFNRTVRFFHRSPGVSGPIPATLGADGWHWIDRSAFLGRKRKGRPRRAREGPNTLEAHVKGFGVRSIQISADEDDYAIQFVEPAVLDVVFAGATREMLDVRVDPLEWKPVQEGMHHATQGMQRRVIVQPGRYRVIASHSVSTGGIHYPCVVDFGEVDLDLVSGANSIDFIVPPSNELVIETTGLHEHDAVGLRLVAFDMHLPFGRVDEDGRVQFGGLPAGEYVLSAGKGKSTLEVTMPCRTVTYDVQPIETSDR